VVGISVIVGYDVFLRVGDIVIGTAVVGIAVVGIAVVGIAVVGIAVVGGGTFPNVTDRDVIVAISDTTVSAKNIIFFGIPLSRFMVLCIAFIIGSMSSSSEG
jgi:hypothetical protein